MDRNYGKHKREKRTRCVKINNFFGKKIINWFFIRKNHFFRQILEKIIYFILIYKVENTIQQWCKHALIAQYN